MKSDSSKVWVVVHFDFPQLPRVQEYLWVRDTPKGVVVRHQGNEIVVRNASYRTVCRTKDETWALYLSLLVKARKRVDEIDAALTKLEAEAESGIQVDRVDSEELPLPPLVLE